MRFPRPLYEGVLLRRYKRFLADVRLDDGRELTVHCASPGSMTGCDAPGSRVVRSDSGNPKRRLRCSWELVRVGKSWVAINSSRSNAVVEEALLGSRVAELEDYTELEAEVAIGDSRLDFRLSDGDRRCWVEVKNATLAEVAMFPDAVTARGLRHLDELAGVVRGGDRGVIFYLVSRTDCVRFRPAEGIDPAYAAGLRRAVAGGVEALAYRARIRRDGITIGQRIPVEL